MIGFCNKKNEVIRDRKAASYCYAKKHCPFLSLHWKRHGFPQKRRKGIDNGTHIDPEDKALWRSCHR